MPQNPVVHPDFPIGVNHILLNKDPKKGRAPWNPPALEDVEFSHIKRVYFSNPPPFKNPPLPVLPPSSFRGTPYSQYPHARYSLPTEADVQSHMKDAGSKTLTQADVVSSVVSAWNGKIGVKEKVEEVLARRCVVSPQGSLTWPSGRRD
jgi:3-hydroxyisobutyryl-CoA hydrolase